MSNYPYPKGLLPGLSMAIVELRRAQASERERSETQDPFLPAPRDAVALILHQFPIVRC